MFLYRRSDLKTIPIIGLPVAATTYREAVEWVLEHAARQDCAYAVEAANTHVAALARVDLEFGEAMNSFDLICPDGMPLVWVLNSKLADGSKLKERVYGPTLMLETLKATAGKAGMYKHFLLGGKQETLDKLSQTFNEKFSDVCISGSYSPPFGKWPVDEVHRIGEAIRSSGANLIWVGLGCPKQEVFISKHKHLLPPGVYFGIGAAFAFHAGEVSQAPTLIQRYGLEWAYRLIMEPRRLFKRYFIYNSLFFFYLLRDQMKD